MKEFDLKTKCRAIFITSVNVCYDFNVELDGNFFNTLHAFAKELLSIDNTKYIEYLNLILYFRYRDGKVESYEDEETIKELFDIIDTIHTFNDVSKLYDEVGQDKVDKITELTNLFISYEDYINQIPVYPIKQ